MAMADGRWPSAINHSHQPSAISHVAVLMKLCRYNDGRLGVVEGDHIRDATAALDVLPAYRYPLPSFDPIIANLDAVVARARAVAAGAHPIPVRSGTLLSPVANPGKIVCARFKYQKHLEEVRDDASLHQNVSMTMAPIQTAGLFLKAPSALVGPGQGIALRKIDRRNDHEVELAVVIGRRANNISADSGHDYVAGYALRLDITIPGPEGRGPREAPDSYQAPGPVPAHADP